MDQNIDAEWDEGDLQAVIVLGKGLHPVSQGKDNRPIRRRTSNDYHDMKASSRMRQRNDDGIDDEKQIDFDAKRVGKSSNASMRKSNTVSTRAFQIAFQCAQNPSKRGGTESSGVH